MRRHVDWSLVVLWLLVVIFAVPMLLVMAIMLWTIVLDALGLHHGPPGGLG